MGWKPQQGCNACTLVYVKIYVHRQKIRTIKINHNCYLHFFPCEYCSAKTPIIGTVLNTRKSLDLLIHVPFFERNPRSRPPWTIAAVHKVPTLRRDGYIETRSMHIKFWSPILTFPLERRTRPEKNGNRGVQKRTTNLSIDNTGSFNIAFIEQWSA